MWSWQKREKTRICDSYAITARYVTMSALPSPRTSDGAVSGTLTLIWTENSQDSATRHPIFLVITAKLCDFTEIPRKDRTNPCVADLPRRDQFTAQSAENHNMQLPAS